MIKPPLPPNEIERLAALHRYDILDTLPEEELDGLTRLAASILGTPIALVSLIDANRQWFKSRVGLAATETPRDFAFCAHTILDAETMIIPDAHRDERFHDNPLVTSSPFVRFYAGAPLTVPTGERIGTLCVIDHEPRTITPAQVEALETIARHVAAQLELRRRIVELDHAREQLQQAKAESRMLGREDRFRILSDAAPVGIYETDVHGYCLYTNPAWQEIAGLTFEESLGHGWTRAVHPDDRDTVLAEWNRAIEDQVEYSGVSRLMTPAGEVRYIEGRARAIIVDGGEIEGYVGAVKEITARYNAEAELQASRAQLERVVEGSTDGFWDWDVTTGEVQFSKRWAQMIGYELDEIEPSADSWKNLVHPDDRARAAEALQAHFEGRLPHFEAENRIRTRSGAWKWFLDRGKVTERAADGTPLRMAGTHADIDARKRVEELLERFFKLSIDLLCIATLDGTFKRVNPAFEETFGYATEELLSRPFLDYIHPDDRERTVAELTKLSAGEMTLRFENRYVCRDGSVKWIAWTATPHPEEGLVYAAGRDVTQERIVTHELAESEERYRDLFENATDMIQAVDPDGRFLYVNAAWLTTLGYEAAEIRGLNIFDILDPDERENCGAVIRRVMGGERGAKLVTAFRTRGGERRIVEGSVSCRFESGRPIAIRGIFRDITEQQKAEEEGRARQSAMHSMIESSLSGILTFDQRGLMETINPAAERILGYTSAELTGQSVAMLMANRPQDFETFQRRAVDDALGRVTEWDLVRGDGRIIQIELALFEFNTVRGRQLAGNIQDISQRRDVERMKREFVSTISHELRTPLTSIRGSLDLLEGEVLGPISPAAHEVLSIANRNTTRLIGLINDILDLDRLDSGKMELTLEPIEVETLFRAAIDSVRGFAEQNGIVIECSTSEAVVVVDAHRLTQVLVNLLSNAVKFSPSGSAVSLAASEEGGAVVVRVTDRGRGIPADFQNRIFDRFQQVEASDSRRKGGSGLGLAISRAIVEQHGGRIGVISEEGKGSTFWIRLASARVHHGAALTAERPIGAFLPTAETAGALEATLRNEGYPVLTFADADHAEIAFRGGLSMLIVELDRGGEGAALLSRIRKAELQADIPIIVLASSCDTVEWFDDNLTVFLSTTDNDTLIAAIRTLAGESSASDVVVIEDDPALLGLLRRQLENEGMRVRTAGTGGAGVAMIRKTQPKVIVLDVGLPDIDGFDVVSVLRRDEHVRRLPLLVYSGRDLGSDERAKLKLGPTRFLTKATSDDHEFRRNVLELIGSASAEQAV